MLAPSLAGPGALQALQAEWSERASLRVEPFLDDEVARSLLDAARALDYTLLCEPADPLAYQYLVSSLVPDPDCDHPLCKFGRWLWSEGVAFASAITAIGLAPPEPPLVLTNYDKGCYLDPHNDYDGSRKVGFVIGLTETAWPAEEGGHLEFLAGEPDGVRVIERRPPGWNTIDLFDVRAPDRPHAVPIVRRRAERRAISGWFH